MSKNNAYSIETLTLLYSQSISSSFDAQIVKLIGVYHDRKGKMYNSLFYDELISENKKNKITIRLSRNLKSKLVSGKGYQLEGFVNKGKSVKDSTLNIFFHVTKIVKHEEEIQLISKAEYDIVQERFNRDFPIIQDILLRKIEKGKRPVIVVITGIQSTSKADYLNQLQDMQYYSIYHHSCNLSSQTEIQEFVDSYDFTNTDLIIILRGGGSGLEVFNEVDFCKKMIQLPVPFVTGIGHHEDVTLLQRVSDRAFSTPTSVGVFLQNVINIHKERTRIIDEKDTELVHIRNDSLKEKTILKEQINHQKKILNKLYFVLIIMMLLIVLLVFKSLK